MLQINKAYDEHFICIILKRINILELHVMNVFLPLHLRLIVDSLWLPTKMVLLHMHIA